MRDIINKTKTEQWNRILGSTPFTTHGILLVVIKFDNRKTRLAWCNEEKWWTTQYQWSKVIFNDDSQVGNE
jgi:hypothetical protein